MLRRFDDCDGRTFYRKPHIVFNSIDLCEDCLERITNVCDESVMGYGLKYIIDNPEIEKKFPEWHKQE